MQMHQNQISSVNALIAEAGSRLGEAVKAYDPIGIKAANSWLDSGNKILAERLP